MFQNNTDFCFIIIKGYLCGVWKKIKVLDDIEGIHQSRNNMFRPRKSVTLLGVATGVDDELECAQAWLLAAAAAAASDSCC